VKPQVKSVLTLSSDTNQVKLIESGDLATHQRLVLRASVTKNATHSLTNIGYLSSPTVIATIPAQSFPSSGSIGNIETTAIYKPNAPFSIDGNNYYKILTFTLSATDEYPTTVSVGSTLKTVYPYFYGAASMSATQSADMQKIIGTNSYASIGKLKSYLVEPIISSATYSDNQYLKVTTVGLGIEDKGYIYFGYPSSLPLLKKIYDDNSNIVTNDFKTYSVTLDYNSVPKYWNSVDYTFYIKSETKVPLSAGTFSFIFAE